MWIKRREYEELKKVRNKYVDVMKAIHNAENGHRLQDDDEIRGG